MKKCPYCAEEIQDEAIICRFCGREINEHIVSAIQLPSNQESLKKLDELEKWVVTNERYIQDQML
jgi:predicted amidophosphoribosyltransferase